MNDADNCQIPGLTPAILQEICPVAPSDRRLNHELFEDFISKEDAKNDHLFYSALLHRIRENHLFFREFNKRLTKNGKQIKKSFIFRSRRWLSQRYDKESVEQVKVWLYSSSDEKVEPLDKNLFPPSSPEYEVLQLCKVLVSDMQDQQLIVPPFVSSPDPVDLTDWQMIRDRLRDSIEALDTPDSNRAEAIRADAEALVNACAVAAQKVMETENLNDLRVDLTNRLSPLKNFAEGATLLDKVNTADKESLEMLAEAVSSLLDLHQACVTAENLLSEANTAYDEAWLTKDRRLIANRNEAVEKAEAAYNQAQNDLFEALASALAPFTADEEPKTAEPTQYPIEEYSASVEADPLVTTNFAIPAEAPDDSWEELLPVDDQAIPSLQSTHEEESKPLPSVDSEVIVFPAASVTQPYAIMKADVESNPKDDTAPIWGGEHSLDQLLVGYLDTGEYVLAFHLADLAEEKEFVTPLPAAVLKALAVAPVFGGHWDAVAQEMDEVLAGAMAAVETVELASDENASERVRAVAFAALLRPAFLVPDRPSARLHLRNLPMRGNLVAYSGLHRALTGLMYDFNPNLAELGELAGTERERRLPKAECALREWLDQARSARYTHAPTYRILNQVASQGEVGRVIEAALNGLPKADQLARDLIQNWVGNRTTQEKLIAQCEMEMGRPPRDKIRGMALDWACRKLHDGCERLQDWLLAFEADRVLLNDNRRQTLQRQIGPLKKALSEINQSDNADNTEGLEIDGAVTRIVWNAIKALRQLIEGGEQKRTTQRLHEALDLPLLRLPGGCQSHIPRADDPSYVEEYKAQRKRLLIALQKPEVCAADEYKAFESRLKEHAILPARRLMERLKQSGSVIGEAAEAAKQELDEVTNIARRQVLKDVESLRIELATLYNLDLGTGDAVRQWLDRLEAIQHALTATDQEGDPQVQIPAQDGLRTSDIPPDFPELKTLLDKILNFRDELRVRILEDQRARLHRLIQDKPTLAEDARKLAAMIDIRDPVTVEDMIAQLQAGLPLTGLDAAEEDALSTFFPVFVEAVSNATPEVLNKGLIDDALKEGKRLGPLDFSGLDTDARRSAHKLLESWRRTENAMKPPGDLRDSLRDVLRDALQYLMETLGFTSVLISHDNQLIPGRLRRFQMRTAPLVSERWFLPPVFGSEASGFYPLFLSRPEVQNDQLSTELGKAGRESPCLLLVFGKLSRQRREDFARRMHRDKQSVLLIDETQIF